MNFNKLALGVSIIVLSFTLLVGCGSSSEKTADTPNQENQSHSHENGDSHEH